MEDSNQTSSSRFILLGLTNIPHLQAIYVLLFFIVYITTLWGNSLLIIVVRINEQLQTPMYFFLRNLSIIDICFSSTIVPRIIINTLSRDRSVSLLDCALQMFFHLSVGGTECLILAVMAYDRPHSAYSDRDKIVSVIYSAVIPMLNPIIYSMRNKDVKGTIRKRMNKHL
ncbi:hypothetical protein XELAEV_18040444mg [Xenopus laevis]|uniref:G-protein coupled receptors family 1 profile domain-containing protein n=1 Tax=Xenopus laevis TaxID=8355 RepID=A0A974CAN9_XENLA|nr:hypothetical protein XELAEV_18040444mg [Xenopus laevis]